MVATLKAVEEVAEAEREAEAGATDWTGSPLTELCDHIVATHHQYLYEELPRLEPLIAKVVDVHGERHPSLLEVQEVFGGLRDELVSHLMKEEQVLFPAIRQLESGRTGVAVGAAGTVETTKTARASGLPFGSLANPIRVMEMEHDSAGRALVKIRELTDGYTPPADACNSYRSLLTALAKLEQDLHMHIHKENNILFPRVIAAEQGQ